jgi:nitroreductase family protein
LVSIIVVLENISTAKLRIVFQNRKHLLNFVASKLSKMKTINTRKTIRKYTNKDVSEDLLKTLLEKAERTPTMGNLQLYSVVITRNEEKKAQLAPAHFNQPMVMGAPVVLTFCADFRRTTLWAENRKATPGYDNFLSFLNAATDALLYCQTFCNLAEEEGLGTCFLGTTIYNPKAIIEVLQLPRLVMPVATITLGWPAEDPALTDRLPIDSIIHNETYEDYTPERIDAFYTPKEQLEENKHFVEINNKETLAQVFTDLRYTKEANEAISKTLLETLKGQW